MRPKTPHRAWVEKLPAGNVPSATLPPVQACARLCGAYACYSAAWSPAHRGQIIRGALRIRNGDGGELEAAYSETLLGDAIQLEGAVEVTMGTVHMLLREPDTSMPVFMALTMPPEPVTVLAGIMAGPCFVVDHSLPTGTRIVAIRVPDGAPLEASNRYLPPDAADVAADLRALGVPLPRASGLGPRRGARIVPAEECRPGRRRGDRGPAADAVNDRRRAGQAAGLPPKLSRLSWPLSRRPMFSRCL